MDAKQLDEEEKVLLAEVELTYDPSSSATDWAWVELKLLQYGMRARRLTHIPLWQIHVLARASAERPEQFVELMRKYQFRAQLLGNATTEYSNCICCGARKLTRKFYPEEGVKERDRMSWLCRGCNVEFTLDGIPRFLVVSSASPKKT